MVGVVCLLVLLHVLNVFLSRGKRIDGRCPSNSRYVLLIGCALSINSSASNYAAARK